MTTRKRSLCGSSVPLAVALALAPIAAASDSSIKAAGVVLYRGGDPCTMLIGFDVDAKPKDRGWSGFVGKASEPSSRQAAARELNEETRGLFDVKAVRAAIENVQPFRRGSVALFPLHAEEVRSGTSSAPRKHYEEKDRFLLGVGVRPAELGRQCA